MRAQASHVGVKKITVTVLIPELNNFGVAIASRMAAAKVTLKSLLPVSLSSGPKRANSSTKCYVFVFIVVLLFMQQ